MKNKHLLILLNVTLLLFVACGSISDSSIPQNEPSEQGSTPQIEIAPDMISVPDNSSSETAPDKNEEAESTAISNENIVPQSEHIPQPVPVPQPKPESAVNDDENSNAMPNISITVGDSVFSVKLYDNSAARTFLAQLPLTLNMSDLNSNEKYHYLADDLPSESTERPVTMNTGDLMCWSGNCLVLFYKDFSNSYGGYVRLGYIEDASGLAAALGSSNVEVVFAVSNDVLTIFPYAPLR